MKLPQVPQAVLALSEAPLPNDLDYGQVEEIEVYREELLSQSGWTLHSKADSIVIQSLSVSSRQSSIFSSEFPVVCIIIELTGNIAPGLILSTLNDPAIRLQWDSNYKEMEILTRLSGWDFITRTVVDMRFSLMRNREFIERKVIKQEGNVTNIVFYSCDHKAPAADKYVRGFTVFGFQRIEKKQAKVELHLVCQSDLKMPLAAKSSCLVVSRLVKWAKDLKHRLEAAVEWL
jgi:hypothetical protein